MTSTGIGLGTFIILWTHRQPELMGLRYGMSILSLKFEDFEHVVTKLTGKVWGVCIVTCECQVWSMCVYIDQTWHSQYTPHSSPMSYGLSVVSILQKNGQAVAELDSGGQPPTPTSAVIDQWIWTGGHIWYLIDGYDTHLIPYLGCNWKSLCHQWNVEYFEWFNIDVIML